jgi:hypothetical protein
MRLRPRTTAWSWASVDLAAPSVLAIAGEGMGIPVLLKRQLQSSNPTYPVTWSSLGSYQSVPAGNHYPQPA